MYYAANRFLLWLGICSLIGALLSQSVYGLIIGALIGVFIFFHFIPYYIASARNHPNKYPILAINLFLGWSIVGWVVALVWALTVNPIIH